MSLSNACYELKTCWRDKLELSRISDLLSSSCEYKNELKMDLEKT